MVQNNEVHITDISSANEIYSAISGLAAFLYNQDINEPYRLRALSEKYSKSANVLIAAVAGETKGLCVFYDNDTVSKIAFLSMIVVSGDAQGQGIGNALMEEMISRCVDAGMEKIRLEVANTNTAAIQFYVKRGFVLEKETQNTSHYICTIKETGVR